MLRVQAYRFCFCLLPRSGRSAFRDVQYDVRDWLNRNNEETGPAEVTEDPYDFTWIAIRRPPDRFESLIDDLHTASSMFTDNGFGPLLLCAVTTFCDRGDRNIAMVHLYKRGTFYPFAPRPEETRDNRLELHSRDALKGTLPLEPDLARWLPIWGAPGL